MNLKKLAIEIANAHNNKYRDCPKHWDEKASRVAHAETIDQVYAGLLNFRWMERLKMEAYQRAVAERVLGVLNALRSELVEV